MPFIKYSANLTFGLEENNISFENYNSKTYIYEERKWRFDYFVLLGVKCLKTLKEIMDASVNNVCVLKNNFLYNIMVKGIKVLRAVTAAAYRAPGEATSRGWCFKASQISGLKVNG